MVVVALAVSWRPSARAQRKGPTQGVVRVKQVICNLQIYRAPLKSKRRVPAYSRAPSNDPLKGWLIGGSDPVVGLEACTGVWGWRKALYQHLNGHILTSRQKWSFFDPPAYPATLGHVFLDPPTPVWCNLLFMKWGVGLSKDTSKLKNVLIKCNSNVK